MAAHFRTDAISERTAEGDDRQEQLTCLVYPVEGVEGPGLLPWLQEPSAVIQNFGNHWAEIR